MGIFILNVIVRRSFRAFFSLPVLSLLLYMCSMHIFCRYKALYEGKINRFSFFGVLYRLSSGCDIASARKKILL